jgi:hypothetical protein
MEGDIKFDPDIKVKDDPDSIGIVFDDDDDDDDAYEDTGELQIPKNPMQAWLVKIPPELWAPLANMEKDDEDIDIGEIEIWNLPDKKRKNVSLLPVRHDLLMRSEYRYDGD